MKVYDDALKCTNADELCSMITEYKLTWEHLPTTMLTNIKVWQTLLRHMPIEALIRNLGRMTKCGVYPDNSEEEEMAGEKIRYVFLQSKMSQKRKKMSRITTKPTKWHVRPAKTQISLGIRPV